MRLAHCVICFGKMIHLQVRWLADSMINWMAEWLKSKCLQQKKVVRSQIVWIGKDAKSFQNFWIKSTSFELVIMTVLLRELPHWLLHNDTGNQVKMINFEIENHCKKEAVHYTVCIKQGVLNSCFFTFLCCLPGCEVNFEICTRTFFGKSFDVFWSLF